jgi:MoxR-like ATPase
MSSLNRLGAPLTTEAVEARLRALAQVLLGEIGVDDLEMRHLLEILTRSSPLLTEEYDPGTMDRILSGERRSAGLLDTLTQAGGDRETHRLSRVLNVPDVLRTYGDRCLYDVGLAGRDRFRGIDLKELGPKSYSLASRVLALLSEDRHLREFYERNQVEHLPIEEEVLFLKQCATRFRIYAQLLQAFRGQELSPATVPAEYGGPAPELARTIAAPTSPPPDFEASLLTRSAPADPGPAPAAGVTPFEAEARGLDRMERLARYERALLLSGLELGRLRSHLKERVVDQDRAIDQVCDDLSVFVLGTRSSQRPQSYLFVGPTGVGKNYLVESLVHLLEEEWGVEIPFLVLEGPQYTYPSDVNELKGATRGFIRSDEEGLLSEFHEKVRVAPLSVLLVDEVEKAHPQLARFFLSLMDRGTTMDNRGRLLRFPATLLIYTSNLGYSEEQMAGQPIGYNARRKLAGRLPAAARTLQRSLSPEFLNRLRAVHFAPLTQASAGRIVDQEAARVAERYFSRHGIRLVLTPAARQALVEQGFSEEYGARHLVGRVDRVLNVEVSLRLEAAPSHAARDSARLLARIRQARQETRAVDEAALSAEVARCTRRRRGAGTITVDWSGATFVYTVDEG